MSNESKYEKIIKQQHHVSKRHPQLSKDSYAAQFSPFAALTGYDGIVAETARLTDERVELGETDMEILSAKLQILADRYSNAGKGASSGTKRQASSGTKRRDC